MKKNTPILIAIILFVVIVGFLLRNATNETGQNSANSNFGSTTAQSALVLFASSPLAQNAYLISTSTYDASTTRALSGFTVTKKALPDGSTQITLNSQNAEYQTQVYTIKPGEKLYFIEKFLADDSASGDRNIKDDSAVVVDKNGYIVNQP
jgi:hypothetical protein